MVAAVGHFGGNGHRLELLLPVLQRHAVGQLRAYPSSSCSGRGSITVHVSWACSQAGLWRLSCSTCSPIPRRGCSTPSATRNIRKDLAGWLIAADQGTGGYPTHARILRNTLMSGGLFTGLFAGAPKAYEHRNRWKRRKRNPYRSRRAKRVRHRNRERREGPVALCELRVC